MRFQADSGMGLCQLSMYGKRKELRCAEREKITGGHYLFLGILSNIHVLQLFLWEE
jgi:hypothetical protein